MKVKKYPALLCTAASSQLLLQIHMALIYLTSTQVTIVVKMVAKMLLTAS